MNKRNPDAQPRPPADIPAPKRPDKDIPRRPAVDDAEGGQGIRDSDAEIALERAIGRMPPG